MINFPDQFPNLTTERLHLVAFNESDIDRYLKLRSDKEFIKYLGVSAMDYNDAKERIAQITQDFKDEQGISWKICLKNNDELIGYIGFWRIDQRNQRGEIGFGLDKGYQKKGLMHEAMNEVLSYGFSQLQLHSVIADVDPDNQASITLLVKSGFKKEAHFRENYFFQGTFFDSAHYCLLKKDLSSII